MREAMQQYEAKDYSKLLGLAGFSDTLLNNHFKLYNGYVTNTNNAAKKLKEAAKAGTSTEYDLAEVRRRFGWEFNGMRLHEYYFGNLSKAPTAAADATKKALAEGFGSFEQFQADFVGAGKARGIGWVILAQDPQGKGLFTTWVNEHDVGILAGSRPLLVLDVFEHAYVTDYQLDKPAYLGAFWKAIDWTVVGARLAGTRDD